MKKSRVSIALLLAVVMSLAFMGCQRQADDGRMHLTFWTLETRRGHVEPLIREFMAANPDVTITPSFFSTDGIKDALHVAATSRTLPDMWFNWGGSLGGFYAEHGLVFDLTAHARANNWERIFSPGALQLCTLHGILAGHPHSFNVLAMFYRRDIFERFNLTAPTTLAELETIAETLVANGIIPFATAGLFGWHTMRYLEQLIEYYAGPELHDRLSFFQANHNSEPVIRALARFQDWVNRGFFPPGFVTSSPDDLVILTASGLAAMDLQGQWFDGTLLQNDQDLSLFGTFPFPTGSRRLSAFAEMTQFNAAITPARLEAAMRLMDHFYSRSAVERFGRYLNLPLPRLDAEMPANMPNVARMFDFSNRYGTFTITDQAFPTEVADALFRVQDGLALNQITPQQGAVDLQTAIEAHLRTR